MAALDGTLPPQNSYCGPIKSSSQNDTAEFWVVLRDAADNTLVSAWWASDPLAATPWTEITTNQPDFVDEILSLNVWPVDNKLYVVAQNASDDIYFARLDMDQDVRAWEVVTGSVHETVLTGTPDGAADACDLTVESDGAIMHVFYQGVTDKVHGTNYERIHHLRTNNADTATVMVGSGQNNVFGDPTGDQFDWTGPRCVLGASDRTHVLGISNEAGGNNDIWENDVTTGGAPTATNDTDTALNTVNGENYPIGHGVTVNRAGTVKGRIPTKSPAAARIAAFDSGASPSFSEQAVSAQNPAVVNSSAGICLASLGSTIWTAFADATDNDVDSEEDADSDTWTGTPASITTNASQVHINAYDTEAAASTTGPVLGILHDSDGAGGTPLYAERDITISESALSAAKMGEFHSHHGPDSF